MTDQAPSGGGGRAGASSTRSVADVMTTQLVSVTSRATVADAARLMRDHDIGPVLVIDGDEVMGIVTDLSAAPPDR